MSETYRIVTIQDILKVPPERREACFRQLEYALAMLELADVSALKDGIEWTDDGDNSVVLQIGDESLKLELKTEA